VRGVAALLLVGLLSGCRSEPEAPRATVATSPLEAAARDAGLVDDPGVVLPTGLFENRHAAGRDSLCFRPIGGQRYRFGAIASFGSTLICEGGGTATHDGGDVTLTFEGAALRGGDCRFTASYDGRSVRFPGVVPAGCSALCGPRASMSGVSFDRSGWAEADALTLRSRGASRIKLCQ
jgi:hypothetical protein